MNCSEFRKSLDNYELLDDRGLADMECHAQMCDMCRSELEFYKSIIQTTASIPIPDPPADLIDKVNARIDNEPRLAGTVNNIVWSVRTNARRYATLAACLAVGLAVSLNIGVIKDSLSGGGDDGVISEHNVSATQVPDPVKSDAADGETEKTISAAEQAQSESSSQKQQDNVSDAKQTMEAVSVSAEKKLVPQIKETEEPKAISDVSKAPSVSLPIKTNSPDVTEVATSSVITAETVIKTPVPETDSATEAPVISSRTAAPAATEKSIGKYTIARANYYIPEEETAEAETVTEEPSAEEYEIKKAGYQIAQGDYSGNVKEAGGVSSVSISDKIIVNAADADAVAGVISSLGIPSTNGFYTTVSATFYELLSRLDAEGIEYSYSLQYSSGDKVVFKLVMR
ncbi:MAG: anti-sigma factor family protein [Candidatus Ornithomonoglobus sp.]